MSDNWSFALITDIHLGAFYSGYGGKGYSGGDTGLEYFLTDRLRRTVDYINENKDGPDNIEFVAVLGDITESAEESEFYMAKQILDGLAVPYVPLFGNHDVWPYSSHVQGNAPSGSEVFNEVFESAFAALAASPAISGWAKDTADVAGSLVNNYCFDVAGVHFLALDLVCRDGAPSGVGANGRGVFNPPTRTWLEQHLDAWGAEPVVLLSHHPVTNKVMKPKHVNGFEWQFIRPLLQGGLPSGQHCSDIAACLQGHNVLAAFAGHSHSAELLLGSLPTPPFIWNFNEVGFEPIGTTQVCLTEAMQAGSNGKTGQDKGTIRMVKVTDGPQLDWQTVVGPDSPATNHALNPSFDATLIEGYAVFIPHRFTKQDVEFQFDYGDGSTSGDFEGFEGGWWERANLLDSEMHVYTDGKEPHVVTLTVREKIADDRYFEEKISREVWETVT